MKASLNEKGWEMPDPKKVSLASGLKKRVTLEDTIRRVMSENAAKVALQRLDIEETPEESEDFDTGEDGPPLTEFEYAAQALPMARVREMLKQAVRDKPSLWEKVKNLYTQQFGEGWLPEPEKAEPSKAAGDAGGAAPATAEKAKGAS